MCSCGCHTTGGDNPHPGRNCRCRGGDIWDGMIGFDAMIDRHVAAQEAAVQRAIDLALVQAEVNGGGLRVERWNNRHVIVITDTVPAGTVEHVRINDYYDLKEPNE